MFTLRCTKKLLQRMGIAPAAEPPAPTTRLGDWYAVLLYTSAGQLVLAVSERTLLPVVLLAKDSRSLPSRLPLAARDMLLGIGVRAAAVDAEIAEMRDVVVGRTASRQVLGSLNELGFMLEAGLRGDDTEPLIHHAFRLSGVLCGQLGIGRPREATLEVFASTLH